MAHKKIHERVCEQCETKFMSIGARQRFCTRRCAMNWRHEHVGFKYKTGSDSPLWKSETIAYSTMHARIFKERGRAVECVLREERGCTSTRFEWAHVHGTDPRDTASYRMLCKSCHAIYDAQARGGAHLCAKLTAEQTAEIRSSTESRQSLADRFNVSLSTIGYTIRRTPYERRTVNVS